ncbi:hypothetical protein DFS34DRAFT_434365 [Phlyctochytrium arcticum]|nr:hypothetical protein DFS34DRAFT_434365 [Phlyctochytrium arcticum]
MSTPGPSRSVNVLRSATPLISTQLATTPTSQPTSRELTSLATSQKTSVPSATIPPTSSTLDESIETVTWYSSSTIQTFPPSTSPSLSSSTSLASSTPRTNLPSTTLSVPVSAVSSFFSTTLENLPSTTPPVSTVATPSASSTLEGFLPSTSVMSATVPSPSPSAIVPSPSPSAIVPSLSPSAPVPSPSPRTSTTGQNRSIITSQTIPPIITPSITPAPTRSTATPSSPLVTTTTTTSVAAVIPSPTPSPTPVPTPTPTSVDTLSSCYDGCWRNYQNDLNYCMVRVGTDTSVWCPRSPSEMRDDCDNACDVRFLPNSANTPVTTTPPPGAPATDAQGVPTPLPPVVVWTSAGQLTTSLSSIQPTQTSDPQSGGLSSGAKTAVIAGSAVAGVALFSFLICCLVSINRHNRKQYFTGRMDRPNEPVSSVTANKPVGTVGASGQDPVEGISAATVVDVDREGAGARPIEEQNLLQSGAPGSETGPTSSASSIAQTNGQARTAQGKGALAGAGTGAAASTALASGRPHIPSHLSFPGRQSDIPSRSTSAGHASLESPLEQMDNPPPAYDDVMSSFAASLASGSAPASRVPTRVSAGRSDTPQPADPAHPSIMSSSSSVSRGDGKIPVPSDSGSSSQPSALAPSLVVSGPSSSSQSHTPPTNLHIARNIPTKNGAFLPTADDEVELHNGDTVTVLRAFEDGWGQVRNLSRGGQTGFVPLQYLYALDLEQVDRVPHNVKGGVRTGGYADPFIPG